MGYSAVGNDGDIEPYAGQLFYTVNPNLINNSSGTPVPVVSSGSAIPNQNLVPSRVSETEAGMELKMFNRRINLDVAVYKKNY